MNYTNQRNRVLICTSVALVSGMFGAYLGGQISLKAKQYRCQTKPAGWQTVCSTWVSPGAIWQGSTTGLGIGWILGAFFSGLATHQITSSQQVNSTQSLTESIALSSAEIELTPDQREKLQNFLVLLLLKLSSSPPKKLSESELQLLAAMSGKKLYQSELNSEAVQQLLIKLSCYQQK